MQLWCYSLKGTVAAHFLNVSGTIALCGNAGGKPWYLAALSDTWRIQAATSERGAPIC